MTKIGRNDPCPCGSGKKYKKCCANKPFEEVLELTFPRFIHWGFDEIRSMTTGDIISKLRKLGVEFQEEQFLKEVKNHYSACELAEEWYHTYPITAQRFDEDFIWMACVVLWERLAPDIMSSEKLDDMMQMGYDLIRTGRKTEGCDLWLEVWDSLKERFTPEMKDIEQAEEVFSGLQSLFNWCQDVEMKLNTAGFTNTSYFRKRIEYCSEFSRLFPQSDSLIILNMKRAEAESYFILGESERGEELFKSLVEEFPDSIWGYVGWGDMYAYTGYSKTPPNYEKAKQIYRMALDKGVEEEDIILDRIKDLEHQQ